MLSLLIFKLLRYQYLLKIILYLLFLPCYSFTGGSQKNPFHVHFSNCYTVQIILNTHLSFYFPAFICAPSRAVCIQQPVEQYMTKKPYSVQTNKEKNTDLFLPLPLNVNLPRINKFSFSCIVKKIEFIQSFSALPRSAFISDSRQK